MTTERDTPHSSYFLGLGSFKSETSPSCCQGLCEFLIYYTMSEGSGEKKIIPMISFFMK